ncbi:hypothetical protein EYF80_008663 [Liparis tanakae]|uniref:Uncharacterized protein n=1 Tax=Liparis tanakae TaxID=230148 RepID=A0A4Z2ITC6_9TELE|nr:hypothetical protein EYF80_008663 [Liparis tanakae]
MFLINVTSRDIKASPCGPGAAVTPPAAAGLRAAVELRRSRGPPRGGPAPLTAASGRREAKASLRCPFCYWEFTRARLTQ